MFIEVNQMQLKDNMFYMNIKESIYFFNFLSASYLYFVAFLESYCNINIFIQAGFH